MTVLSRGHLRPGLLLILVVMLISLTAPPVCAGQSTQTARFFYSGNGEIHLFSEKNGKTFDGTYRLKDGRYDAQALQKISAVFDAPYQASRPVISLRLIEYLDFLEDRLNPGATLSITSGYRAPEYNTNLRSQGMLAAEASLHQYGMAVDFEMQGIEAGEIFKTVKTLKFGGVGYYHGRTVHIDTGPARSWDETTSGVGLGLANYNKLIGLITDYDVYSPGDTVTLRFIRMTAFPITVKTQLKLIRADKPDEPGQNLAPVSTKNARTPKACSSFENIAEMTGLQHMLPPGLAPGRYRIRADFCDNRWDQMPPSILTPEFEVR